MKDILQKDIILISYLDYFLSQSWLGQSPIDPIGSDRPVQASVLLRQRGQLAVTISSLNEA